MPRSRKSGRKRIYLAAGIITTAIILIVASAVLSYRPSGKPSASQYLMVAHTASIGEFSDQNTTVSLKIIGLNITAIGGEARNVRVIIDSQANVIDDVIDDISQNESAPMEIQLRGYVTALDSQNEFPVELDIGCVEAESATITLYLDPKDIHAVPSGGG
jgi:hypothetical protein